MKSMAQWSVDVVVGAKPYFVPSQSNWAGNVKGLVAITTPATAPSLSVKERSSGFVAVIFGGGVAVSRLYFSPNRSLVEFEVYLERLSSALRRLASAQIMIMGDVNAKSALWGCLAVDARAERSRVGRQQMAWPSSTGAQPTHA